MIEGARHRHFDRGRTRMSIHESLQRLLRRKDLFGTTFYEVFFQHCPEARPHFAGVNLANQAVLITLALNIIEGYYSHHYPAMAMYLPYLGHKHHLRRVPTELFAPFGEAL